MTKCYVIVHIGNDSSEDEFAINKKIYLNKNKAKQDCINLQKYYDEDDKNNPYEFQVKTLELVE